MAKHKGILDQLRDEIRKAEKRGITLYRLAKLSGVTPGMLSRFMADKRNSPRAVTLEKLAEGLELEITLTKTQ